MKVIKIFLASSINDLHLERMEIGNFIRSLNDRFVEQGIYFQLCMCEDASDSLAKSRKQDEFNDVIRDCDYFFIMFWHKAGAYTVEEFEVALQHFRETNAPKIMTYFKVVEEGDCVEQTVMDFMKRLEKEFEHFHSSFVHTDTIKLKLLTILSKEADTYMQLALRDGVLWMNDVQLPFVYPENVPFYRNHDTISCLRIRVAELKEQQDAARSAAISDPDNGEAWEYVYVISHRLKELQNELHGHETKLLETFMCLFNMTTDGSYINSRTKKAIELFEMGDMEGALSELDQESFEADFSRAEEVVEVVAHQMEALVKELTTRIAILKAQGVTQENEAEIKTLYEKARKIILAHRLELGDVVDFLSFLCAQNDHTHALEIGDQLYHEYKSRDDTRGLAWARFCSNLAEVYSHNQKRADAESLYLEALKIYDSLSSDNPAAYEPAVADIFNRLAMLYEKTDDAEKRYKQALEILRRLANANPAAYMSQVATTCNNLAILYVKKEEFVDAKRLYQEALDIYCSLSMTNPYCYEPLVAITCNNLAVLYMEIFQTDDALTDDAFVLFQETLDVYRRLSCINPSAYDPLLSAFAQNLAHWYASQNNSDEAKPLYWEALNINRRLAAAHPLAFEPDLAVSCYSLSSLLGETDQERARELQEEAFKIARKYKDDNNACSIIYDNLKSFFE